MLVETPSTHLLPKYVKRRKKCSCFCFSSSKALKKSRMNRKKLVSKTSHSILRELRKSLQFGGGTSRGEEAIVVKNVGGVQEMSNDISIVPNQGV